MKQRSTRQRRLVLETVLNTKEHPTADTVYLIARATDPRISRGTVYRNLNLLVGNGELRHVRLTDVDRFDWRVEKHYHVLCTRCGKVMDIPLAYRGEMDREIAEATGFDIARHLTVFEGICPECRAKDGDAGHSGTE